MEKKTYTTPEIEVIDLDNQPAILVESSPKAAPFVLRRRRIQLTRPNLRQFLFNTELNGYNLRRQYICIRLIRC